MTSAMSEKKPNKSSELVQKEKKIKRKRQSNDKMFIYEIYLVALDAKILICSSPESTRKKTLPCVLSMKLVVNQI